MSEFKCKQCATKMDGFQNDPPLSFLEFAGWKQLDDCWFCSKLCVDLYEYIHTRVRPVLKINDASYQLSRNPPSEKNNPKTRSK